MCNNMSLTEEQSEEQEVLASIFEDDSNFKQVNDTCYQYKIGEDGHAKSFLIEFIWLPTYPEVPPEINLDAFYNNHILDSVKADVQNQLTEQASGLIGEAMLYSIIDWAKENHEDLMKNQLLQVSKPVDEPLNEPKQPVAKPKVKKEQLTKAQKRKMADRVNMMGERPRGWNWVDPIKHLSQTGGIDQQSTPS
uniref:RWD domain-containing protein 4-like n=1 Tax=Phallusia mammillata TaxID=59560 RepID=A0A6F9DS89_9ASCI|nr:RWD domain-containing protein 4-like [Phallusia mammillata]